MASESVAMTFFFTDIEGSTQLWDRYPEQMRAVLALHDSCIRTAIESNGGTVFKTLGDAFCAAFPTASGAAAAAIAAQWGIHSLLKSAGLQDESGLHDETANPLATDASEKAGFPGLRVRMALHRGAAEARDGDFFGGALNRVDRLLEICHGGQTLITGAVAVELQDEVPLNGALRDLGIHRLKDLQHPEHIFQLDHPELPGDFEPLRSLENTPNNLPR